MIFLLLAVALTEAQQLQHDATEYAMYQTLQNYHSQIIDDWRPSARLFRDYDKANACYVAYHLYKTNDCRNELSRVAHDLERPGPSTGTGDGKSAVLSLR